MCLLSENPKRFGIARNDFEGFLHWAINNGNDSVAEYLIEGGVDVDSVDYSVRGRVPLSSAIFQRRSAIAKKLIEAGANVNYQVNCTFLRIIFFKEPHFRTAREIHL